jgi:hypothetical protein
MEFCPISSRTRYQAAGLIPDAFPEKFSSRFFGYMNVQNSLDFPFAPYLILEYPEIAGPVPNTYETLMAVPLTSHYAASGRYLNNLENLLALPKPIHEQLAIVPFSLAEYTYTNPVNRSAVQPLLPAITFEVVMEQVSEVVKYRIFADYLRARRTVSQAERLRRLIRRLLIVRRLVHRSVSRYCGLNWSRRLWFLLHGSHPPKAEGCPAFGCA